LGPANAEIPLLFIRSNQECLNQAALVSGAQVMTDASMCALIIQVAVVFHGHGQCISQTYIALVGFQSCHPWTSYTWTNSMDDSCGALPSLLPVIGIYMRPFITTTASSSTLCVSIDVLIAGSQSSASGQHHPQCNTSLLIRLNLL
jgi:hypothetical protein